MLIFDCTLERYKNRMTSYVRRISDFICFVESLEVT